jgi:hypothetical protein
MGENERYLEHWSAYQHAYEDAIRKQTISIAGGMYSLMVEFNEAPAVPVTHIVLVQNWFEELTGRGGYLIESISNRSGVVQQLVEVMLHDLSHEIGRHSLVTVHENVAETGHPLERDNLRVGDPSAGTEQVEQAALGFRLAQSFIRDDV